MTAPAARPGKAAGRPRGAWCRAVAFSLALAFLLHGCGNGEVGEGEERTPTYHIGMGKTLYQRGDYAGAVRMFEKAIGMDRSCAEAFLQMGIIYDNNLKDKAQALFCYRRFLSLEPDSMMAEMVKEWCAEIEKDLPPAASPPPIFRPTPSPGRSTPRPTPSAPPPPTASPTRAAKKGPESAPPAPARPSPSPSAVAPRPTPARAVSAAAPSRHTVKSGETLARLAAVYYGDRNAWKTIFDANRDLLKKPEGLRPGMVIVIPPRGK